MPRIKDIFINDSAFASSSYTGSWENISSSKYYTISVYCSVNCSIIIENSFDSVQVVKTSTTPLIGGSLIEITSPILTSFIKISVNVLSNPCDLKIEGFFFTD